VGAVRERMAFERRESWTDPVYRTLGGGALRVDFGRIAGVPVILAKTGDGALRARQCTDAIRSHVALSAMIIIGVAGGLDPSLEPGTLLLAESVEHDGRRRTTPLPVGLAASIGARVGVVLTTPDLVTDTESKADLWARDPRRPAVVDLESAAFVESAVEAGLPWLVLRAVSDAASEGMPEYLNDCRDDLGGVRRGAVALHAFRHPTSTPALLTLKRRTDMCAGRLAAAVETMLPGMEWVQ